MKNDYRNIGLTAVSEHESANIVGGADRIAKEALYALGYALGYACGHISRWLAQFSKLFK